MKSIQQVIYWRDPQINGIEICQVRNSRHIFPDHAHDNIYTIGMMQQGGSYCLGPQRSDSLVSPGRIALINPGQVHSGVPVHGKQISYCMIYMDLEVMTALTAEVSRQSRPVPEFHFDQHLSKVYRCHPWAVSFPAEWLDPS